MCLGGTTCRPASVGMLQSGGMCLVLNHECLKLFVVSHGLSLFGLQAAWRPVCIRGGVVKMVLALCWLCCVCGCVFLGSVCEVQARSSSCMAAEVQSWWCRQNGWWHCAVCWFVIACYLGSVYAGFKLGRQIDWRPSAVRLVLLS